MKHILTYITILVLALTAVSCSDNSKPMPIQRLDSFVYNYSNYSDKGRRDTIALFAPGIELYLMYNDERADDPVHALEVMSHSPAVVVFGGDVNSIITDLSAQEEQLGQAAANLQRYLPGTAIDKVYSTVTANPYQSVVVSDSLVLVALNHYLGADYAGYNGLPDYLRRLKTLDRLPSDVVEAVISVNNPYDPAANERLANRMLYDGAILYAIHRMLPDTPLDVLGGWTKEEFDWLESNESRIYGAMIENELLYSTSEDDMQRLLDPAPATPAINANAPGRAARYIGYRIAEKYADAHDSDDIVSRMLSADWYNGSNTLAESGYIYKD